MNSGGKFTSLWVCCSVTNYVMLGSCVVVGLQGTIKPFLFLLFPRAQGFSLMHGTSLAFLGSILKMKSMGCSSWPLRTRQGSPWSPPPSSCTCLLWALSGGIRASGRPSAGGASSSWWVSPLSGLHAHVSQLVLTISRISLKIQWKYRQAVNCWKS